MFKFAIIAVLFGSWMLGAETPDAFQQVRRMDRGVNILGYDPIWKNVAAARFKPRHFALIHDAGFQTVRLNLQAFSHMDADDKLSPEWLRTLDWAVHTALDNHLMVIIDEHDYVPCGEDAEACEPRLLAFWRQIAPRFQSASPDVVFEILNEPNGKVTPAIWNGYVREALAIIRDTNPTRTVVIGPAFWNNIHALNQLELAPGDRNIIVTVHYYLPMEFTHQGASWNKGTAHLSGITWGTDADKARVDADFAGVQAWSELHHRPILLGEFGAYDKAPLDSRVRYTEYVARRAEALGWAWTYWQFDSDFIVWDMKKDDWVEPIRRALLPGTERN